MAGDGETDDPGGPPPGGLSRRAFLRGSAAAGLGAGLLGGAPSAAAPAAPTAPTPKTEARLSIIPIVGPQPVAMSFRINGQPYTARLEPRVTLLDALRDHFDLTGAKQVCDRGTCGACTVLLDGRTVYACSVLAIEAQATDVREIQTIEGLGTVDKLHPIQAAFVENDAQQCGFCTPGFILAAKALLDANPEPTAAELHHGLSGNFCRCGTYAGMRRALLGLAAAAPGDPDAPPGTPDPTAPDPADRPRRRGKKRKKKRRPPHG
jgi:xanthine dehydrogenase YagT iron-sulfur-binding subunit